MRVLLRATMVGLALGVFLAADVMAKGENVNVVIGPIDDLSAGTPTRVTAQVTESGQPTTEVIGAYLSFYEPMSKDQLEFSLNYDATASAYVALVSLPHEGRWLIDAGTPFGTGVDVPYAGSDGTHVVTVRPAPPPEAAPLPAAPFLAGAALASLAWLLGLQLLSPRRRRRTAAPVPATMGEHVPA